MTAAGAVSALSGQQPTGNVAADFVLSFVFGAGLVWLGRFATSQAIVVSSILALFFTGMQMPAALMGLVAVLAAMFMTVWRRFDRESWLIGTAVSVGFTSQTVLNLPNIRFVGSASLLAAIAVAPVVVTAARALPPRYRRRAYGAIAAVGLYALVASLMAVLVALSVRDRVELGIDQAQDGVTAVEDGDQQAALGLLGAAQENFDSANGRLAGPLTWPARFVPIVAQHSRALETASDQGFALARTAARVVERADVDEIRGQNGTIDLELVDAVNTELTSANLVLQGAQRSLLDVRTPWLFPQLSSRLDSVQVELADTAADIDLANHATTVLPAILGAEGRRTYLVLFVQPAESREYGGLVGAYGLLVVDQGRITLAESGSMEGDFGDGIAAFTSPSDFPQSYLFTRPDENPQNLSSVADLSTIARAARDLAPQWRQDSSFELDGVITIDPYALAPMLELTGPILLEGRSEPVTADNVVDFLVRDQYAEFDTAARDARQDLLKVLAGEAFDRLLRIDVPGPERLGSLFGPVARSNRLSFVTFDEFENVFLDRVFLTADLPQVPESVELLAIYTATGTASKLDGYTTRTTTYVVDVDPATGEVNGQGTVALTNGAPVDASPYVLGLDLLSLTGEDVPLGTNQLAVSVYHHGEIADLATDYPFEILETSPALGYQRLWSVIEIPLGETAELAFSTQSQVEPGRYDLVVPASQSAQPGDFTLIVRPAPGWTVVADDAGVDGVWERTVNTDSGNAFALTFARVG